MTGPVTPDRSGRYLAELLGRPFTPEQLEVITAPLAPQLVVAGAGSGKTTVMAARVVHAVAWHGLRPGQILGLTFTNKAAAELGQRVRMVLRRLDVPVDPEEEDDAPTVSTYHAYAANLVADHAVRIGREPHARLLTESGRWQLAGSVVRNAPGPFPYFEFGPQQAALYLLALDAELAEHLVEPDQVREFHTVLEAELAAVGKENGQVKAARQAARARGHLLELVEAYRRRKQELDLLDFGDQVALAARIAREHADVGAGERDRYRLVLLDEYQDTSVSQRVLLSSLYQHHPVSAVGDPCQAIYGWRGASVGNLINFHEHFGLGVLANLSTNFRSGGRLLHLANAVSHELRAESRVPVRELAPAPGAERVGEVRLGYLDTVTEEISWMADHVEKALADGVPPGEVAVLCRRRADFAVVHAELAGRGLPVEVVGLGGLLEMPEVADIVATLEVLADPTANAALVRLLIGPRWMLGVRDLAALGARARALAAADRPPDDRDSADGLLANATRNVDACDVVSLLEAVEDPGDPAAYSTEAYQRLGWFRRELDDLRSVLEQPVVEAVHEVATRIGLDVEVLASEEPLAVARSANLTAFYDHAARYVGLEGEVDVRSFLNWLRAARAAEDGLDVGAVSDADTIKLLTVHKAKGLEWTVVAVPFLTEGIFPPGKGRGRWYTSPAALPYPLRGDARDLPGLPASWIGKGWAAYREECKAVDAAEERRLAYVAVTRAKHTLIASGSAWQPQVRRPRPPSDYLADLASAGARAETWVTPGDTNPLDASVTDHPWPVSLAPAALARRRDAADLVLRALAGEELAAETPLRPNERELVTGWARDAELLLDELTRQRSPVRDIPVPHTLTTSQLVQMRADPAALAASLARPLPRRPSAAARRGTQFHRWVQDLWSARPLFDDLPGAADAGVEDADLRALRKAFEKSVYASVAPVAVEAPFQLVLGSHLVRGRIDAVYGSHEGGYDVIDYKTGARPRDPVAAALQLAVYRVAWADLAGVPLDEVTAGFLYVRTGEIVRPDDLPGREELMRLLEPPTA
ncbi:MAG: UvrD-helicase domain-containing protein [Mycobacteriales bacterium]